MRVAISGFGRIGKGLVRALFDSGVINEIDLVAINTRSAVEMHAHLLKYDSVYGKWNGSVEVKGGDLMVNGKRIKWINETYPENLPWKELKVDVVVEASGEFRKREDAEKHIKAGAKKVVISAPGKGVDVTIVPGVNDGAYKKEHKIISMASCTTNSLAPVVKVLHEKFGIERGFITTIHAYTSDQNLLDGSHKKDIRRARAAAVNIIPTSTGAAKAIGEIFPELNGKLDGIAMRVPVADGSITDCSFVLKKEVSREEVNGALRKASEGELKGVLFYTEEPIVSSDIIRMPYAGIVDGQLTQAKENLVKVFSWYDNEYGYAFRLAKFLGWMKKHG
ncbi:MAG: type I glyceraldehyde-3-phosphate dehydrogenase [Candidatus Anstonellales archaeon]